nr:RNA polymerase sigma factor [Jeotgalibacillus terrae]
MSLRQTEEIEMAAYQAGDVEALGRIYEQLKQPLYLFIYRYTRDEQLSIDVVQDTFIKIQQYKQSFSPEKGSLKNFLFQTAYRIMIDKLNRRKKWYRLMPFLKPEDPQPANTEDKLTVQQAISSLPEKQRAVILLTYYHDLSQAEIAQMLEIPAGTVKSRLHHAISSLKNMLGGDYL